MKYRGVLVSPETEALKEKGQQCFGTSLEEIRRWACAEKVAIEAPQGVLQGAPDGSAVIVYETLERAVARFDKSSDLAGKITIAESKPK